MSSGSYAPPVDLLLVYGDCRKMREWPDYLELGLGPEHAPELIRMATDEELNWADSDSLEVWAPIHAWRALGQLRAEAAIEPLLRLFHELDDSDWAGEELPEVYAMIGPAATPALTAYLGDAAHGEWPRVTATVALQKIGEAHPVAAARCVSALADQLERFAENEETLNAFLIIALAEMKAIETAPLIERAFDAGAVDESASGDWYDIQVELGLRERDLEFERERRELMDALAQQFFFSPPIAAQADALPAPPKAKGKTRAKAKAKRKQAKAARKLNRKRR